MERYKIIKAVGDGAFGSVQKAVNRSNGEVVAIKTMKKKFYQWEECLALREIKSLRKLSHTNIVKLKEVIRTNDDLHLVFEYLDQNIYELMQSRSQFFPESQIRSIMQQTFSGLAYLHKHGFFHRDLKPENILVQGDICKIADFGLAREVRSRPPFTDYVSTRWYRAPECVLRSTNYNTPIDIFAMGCIMAELYTLRPLFPGNNEADQLLKLCTILGTPSHSEWSEGYRLSKAANLRFPVIEGKPLQSLMSHASSDALDLISKMLSWNPSRRPSAAECLEHPFFERRVEDTVSRESRGLPSAMGRTNSKWSQGSSRIAGNSSKGRWNIKSPLEPKQSPLLPPLKDIPEKTPKQYNGFSREAARLPPVVNDSHRMQMVKPIERPLADRNVIHERNPSRGLYGKAAELRKKNLLNRGGLGNVGNSILGNRIPARGMQKGSILPALNKYRMN